MLGDVDARWAVAASLLVVVSVAGAALVAQDPDDEPGPVAAPALTDVITLDELVACRAGQQPLGEREFASELMPEPGQTYVLAAGLEVLGAAASTSTEPRARVRLREPAPLVGTTHITEGVLPSYDAVGLAQLAGGRVVLKTRVPVDGDAFLSPVAVLPEDGSVVPLLSCESGADVVAVLATAATAQRRTTADVLLAALRQPEGPEANLVLDRTRNQSEIPWERRDPSNRSYEDAPPSVRAQLQEVLVEVIVPAVWRDFPDAVFVRTPLASRGGAAFGAFSDSAAAHARLGATAQDGLPLLVVLREDLAGPELVMVSIPESVWRKGVGKDPSVVVRAPDDLLDRTELLRRLRAGVPVLEVVSP